MRECICDSCGMEFQIEKLDLTKDSLNDGSEVEILSFTCPKCDEKYIVSVRDDYSGQLQKEVQAAKHAYHNSYDGEESDSEHQSRKDVEFKKKKLYAYMNKLKKKYLKELRKRGY